MNSYARSARLTSLKAQSIAAVVTGAAPNLIIIATGSITASGKQITRPSSNSFAQLGSL
jgi:hypothetical protein